MHPVREKMNKALRTIVVPKLRKLGFVGQFPHFRRVRNDRAELLVFNSTALVAALSSSWPRSPLRRLPLTGRPTSRLTSRLRTTQITGVASARSITGTTGSSSASETMNSGTTASSRTVITAALPRTSRDYSMPSSHRCGMGPDLSFNADVPHAGCARQRAAG